MRPPFNPKVKVAEEPEEEVIKAGEENDLSDIDTDFQEF